MKAVKPEKRRKVALWHDDYYVKAYRLAATGLRNDRLAGALGVSLKTLERWLREKPSFRSAVEDARKDVKGRPEETFRQYVYNRLPDDLKEVWDRIEEADRDKRRLGDKELKELLSRAGGRYARMQLFLHAYVHYNFNASEAMRALNLPAGEVNKWVRHEPRFKELLAEIDRHKRNLFEGALVGLVKNGDTAAILFANRTLNRDRGYNDKQDIDVNVKATHDHKHSVEALGLSKQALRELREACRNRDVARIGTTATDAEYEEVKK
jgi:hypothetical protein